MVAPLCALNIIKNLCSRKKWAKFTKIFQEDATPKTSHHAKSHRDRSRSNQLGDRGCVNWASDKKLFCHGQKRVRDARLKKDKLLYLSSGLTDFYEILHGDAY